MSDRILLAGDIGGTNTRLAYYSTSQGAAQALYERGLKNSDYPSFVDLLGDFLSQDRREFSGICLGIAGPVIGNRVKITNLDWEIDGDDLRDRYGLEGVWLLNDLKALSYAVLQLPETDLAVLREGKPVAEAPIAVIAPGTGLGEGFLVWDGSDYQAVSTEGGHTDFGPANELQDKLAAYLHQKGMRVSYERVCSGIGVPNLYAFLRDEGLAPEPDWLREELESSQDMTPVIFNTALDESRDCQICEMVVDLFVSILGAEAGNLALKTLSRGGIYVGGGIPPRILSWLEKGAFLEAVDNKDPHTALLGSIPVKVILNTAANLIGAAYYGLRALK